MTIDPTCARGCECKRVWIHVRTFSRALASGAGTHTSARRMDAEAVTLPDRDARDHEVGRILELLLTYLWNTRVVGFTREMLS